FTANTSDSLTLNLTARNVVPPDCIFLVTLPDEYTFTNGSVAISSASIDGTLTLSTINRDVLVSRSWRDPVEATETSGVVKITRTGGTLLPEGASMTLVFGDMLKKESSGATGAFDVAMQTVDGVFMDSTYGIDGHYFIYLPPTVSDIGPYNSPKSGGVSITIYGAHYGPVLNNAAIANPPAERDIVVGDTSCTNTVWTADTAMVCVLGAGLGGELNVSVAIEGQGGVLPYVVTYDIPVVIRANFSNAPSLGDAASAVTIVGSGFGGIDYGASEWISDSSVSCLAAVGAGGTLRVSATVASQFGTVTEALSYDVPSIELSDVLARNVPITGDLTVLGKGFALGFSASARVGDSACEATE
ncbi:hypothetical protein T484DRAFT_1856538, partial [Baffinella frigidus]